MRNALSWILPVVVVAVGALGMFGLLSARPELETVRRETPAPLVRVTTVELGSERLTIQASGTVRPRTELRVVAEVEGRVTAVSPRLVEGAQVAADEVLVELDRRDYELALVRAQAELARARAALQREEAEAEVAREQWHDLGSGEPSELALRQPQLAEARAGLSAAEAAVADAELDLERTRVRSPFDARVRSEQVDVGQFVARNTELARLYPTDRVEVVLAVADAELFALEHDALRGEGTPPPVELRADFGGAERLWHGRVVRSEGEIDVATRTVRLVAEVDDPFVLAPGDDPARVPLELGLYVRATILGRTLPDIARLPRAALRPGDVVFVIDGEDRLWRREVEVVRRDRESIYVSAGLQSGERVCLSPLETAVDGMRVRVHAEGAP